MATTGETTPEPPGVPQRAQGLLFGDELPDLDTTTGYRGPTACRAAGITYRQLDYWARTGLVEPSVRPASGGIVVPPRPSIRPLLNERYTFDRFVVGANNQLAVAASRAVADKPTGHALQDGVHTLDRRMHSIGG